MRGVYTASYRITGLNSARTLMYLTAPATAAVELLSASIGNESVETNEQMIACLCRVGTLGTPTATTVTPANHENGDQAAGVTAKANVTASEPTYSADTELGREAFASLSGWVYDPTPEERITIPPSGTVGLRLIAPASPAAFDAVVRLTWREIG